MRQISSADKAIAFIASFPTIASWKAIGASVRQDLHAEVNDLVR